MPSSTAVIDCHSYHSLFRKSLVTVNCDGLTSVADAVAIVCIHVVVNCCV